MRKVKMRRAVNRQRRRKRGGEGTGGKERRITKDRWINELQGDPRTVKMRRILNRMARNKKEGRTAATIGEKGRREGPRRTAKMRRIVNSQTRKKREGGT